MNLQDVISADLSGVFFSTSDFAAHITHTPLVGASYDLPAIFDESYQEVDPDTQMVVQSTQPRVRVQRAVLRSSPARGDTMVVQGVVYKVREYHPDGNGVASIILARL